MSNIRRQTPDSRRLSPLSRAAAFLSLSKFSTACCAALYGCALLAGPAQAQTVTVNAAPVQTNIKRLGVNLSHPSYYDSAQMLKNLINKTYGFEGNDVRVIVDCGTLTANTCTDNNDYSSWPSGFANGLSYEVLGGPAKGATGTVSSSTNNNQNANGCGQDFNGTYLPCGKNVFTVSGSTSTWGTGVYVALRGTKSGLIPNPQDVGAQGLWISGTLGTNYNASTDTCGTVCGKQSLDANIGAGGGVTQTDYFDSLKGRMFVTMNGKYAGSFWAN